MKSSRNSNWHPALGIALFSEPQSPQFPTSRINRGVIAALQTFLQSNSSILRQEGGFKNVLLSSFTLFLSYSSTLLGFYCLHTSYHVKSWFDLI